MGLVTGRAASYRSLFLERRAELTHLARRTWEVVLLAAVVGILTGGAVSALDTVILGIEEKAVELPLWLVAGLPAVGLVLAALLLRYIGGGISPSTADEYLRAFHDSRHPLPGRPFVARTMASIATLGLGGPMGLEGPSIYAGTTIGSWIRNLTGRLQSARDRRVLLAAGAAAGVAAIFKAPATGAIFALEVPYQDDFARHLLLPSLVGAATGYLTFAAFEGTEPLFLVSEGVPFNYPDLVAAIGLGILAALGARFFARGLRWAKKRSETTSPWARVLVAGALLAAFVVISDWATGQPLSFGPGYAAIQWALDPSRALWAVAVLLAVRCLGTVTVVGGGGVGGLFVPLVVGGALTGRLVGGMVHAVDESLFTVVGVAAFLGAGYRVPLAAVMFVAETTGQPGFVVPGLLAAVAAELVMGTSSVTAYQMAPQRTPSPADKKLAADASDAKAGPDDEAPPSGAAPGPGGGDRPPEGDAGSQRGGGATPRRPERRGLVGEPGAPAQTGAPPPGRPDPRPSRRPDPPPGGPGEGGGGGHTGTVSASASPPPEPSPDPPER
jgi:CIC family chloride channel protein